MIKFLWDIDEDAAYWDGRNSVGEPVASGVYFYTFKAEMPTARTALAVSQGGSKIYAIGGTGVVQGPGLTVVEIYDPLTDTWEQGAEMPTARVFLGAGTVDTEIYAIGGVAQGLGPDILPTVEALTLKGLSIAASDKKQTVWGDIKLQE